MNFLQTPAAKVVIVWGLSLIAAAVCFGLLRSTGYIKNDAIELGGAFAGFIVSTVILNRVWGNDDHLEIQAAQAGKSFAYEEVLKILNLRNSSPRLSTQVAPLTDYYRARRLGERHDLTMHYATTADRVDLVDSPTHPSATWSRRQVSHSGPEEQHLRKEYRIDVDLGDLAKGETTPIIYNLNYYNAFQGEAGDWLETHVEQPTGRLTMVVLCPDDMRFTSAEGVVSLGRDDPEPTHEQPSVIQDGSMIYWSIPSPTLAGRYAIKWRWHAREGHAG